MYLPYEIPDAQVLITVKTYPLPSNKYNELVCTAGLLPDGKWIRLYPVPFRDLPYDSQYGKYYWVTLDLIRNTRDFRPESYRPKQGVDSICIGERIDTKDGWAKRKDYVFKEVFTSMEELIKLARGDTCKSLGTLKPRDIIDFVIEPTERVWPEKWQEQLLQYNLFDLDAKGEGKLRKVIPKLPYKYSYKFLSEGDRNPRQLIIEDWELGMLYWNSLRQSKGDEKEANRLVRKKYFDEFLSKHDVYLFLGTTQQYHARRAPNPFIIVGVFYPLKPKKPPQAYQPPLFET